MARKKKHRWGEDPTADVAQMGKLAAKGLGRLGSIVKRRAADRHLPEDLQRLKSMIEGFRPTKAFDREIRYQDQLYGYLAGKVGPGVTVTIEKQRGRARPDIVVGEIAIEIKGPTSNQGLASIADKIARYRLRFSAIVCVLFDVQDEVHYDEWLRSIQDPGVVVIRMS